jgi:prophage tail gpP-like protein
MYKIKTEVTTFENEVELIYCKEEGMSIKKDNEYFNIGDIVEIQQSVFVVENFLDVKSKLISSTGKIIEIKGMDKCIVRLDCSSEYNSAFKFIEIGDILSIKKIKEEI